MEAPKGAPVGSTPSEKLLDVWRFVGELGVARAASSPEKTTENGPCSLSLNANYGFVTRLREWYEASDGTIDNIDDVINLEPDAELGGATFDVLLYFFDLRDIVKELWPRAPAASTGLLLPLLFRFFGFYDSDFVTSPRQLYMSAYKLQKSLALMDDEEQRRAILHSACFEKPPRSQVYLPVVDGVRLRHVTFGLDRKRRATTIRPSGEIYILIITRKLKILVKA